jgi:hypothetical protein
MADTQIIAASLSVNSDEAIKNVLKLKGAVADLKKELANTKAGSEEQVAAFKKLKSAEEDLAKANKQLNESNKETSGHFSKIKDGINQLPGAAGAAGKGVAGLNTQFKALLANPIGLILTAIVLALTALYKAFTNTFEGAQKVEQIFAGLKAAAQALFDNLGRLASAVVKLFKFDFSGAVEEIKGVVKAAGDAYTAMAKLTKQAQDLHKEQLANDLDSAEREKKLAILREQAGDESIPIAKRKAALKELKAEAEQNAKDDIDLAKRTAENKIAQLTLEKDGAQKNADEINKIKIEQIKGETDNANELRRIGKQLTATEKQELAEQKAARDKANEEAKKRRQELVEFTNKLTKLQQENELALIKDGNQKELKQLENRIADEKRANQLSFQDKKITRDQLNQLNAALDIQSNIQKDAIDEKHNKEVAAKEAAFQKELAAINGKIRIDGIKDTRQSELVQLEIGYQEKLQQAIEKYKDDSAKLAQIQSALDEQYRVDKAAKEAKFKEEDDKKAFALAEQKQKDILTDNQSTIEQRKAALDAEQVLVQQAFDNKVISELEFNNKTKEMANARMAIAELEAQNRIRTFNIIASALTAFSDLIGKNTAVGKAAAVAATLINTYQAAWSVFANAAKNPASIPFPAYPYIQAGLAVVAGLKTVNDIVKVKTPGGGSGGAAPSATSIQAPAAPIAPTQATTSLDQTSINNIGNAAAGGVNAVRAYVVEQDSAAAAARAARLAGAAVLGG